MIDKIPYSLRKSRKILYQYYSRYKRNKPHLTQAQDKKITTILKELDSLPHHSKLELAVTKTVYLDSDIIEILEDFIFRAKERDISIKLISEKGEVVNPKSYFEFFNS